MPAVLAAPDVPADVPAVEAPLPGLRLEPLEDAEPDADADALPDADADPEVLGLAVFAGVDVDVAVGHGVPVAAAAFLLPVALTLAGGEIVVLVALAEAVPVVVAVAVTVAVAVSVGLLVVPAGVLLSPLLVLPLAGLVTELAGAAFGVTDLLGLAEADAEELGAHAGAVALLWPTEAAPWPRVPLDAPCWVADPARLGTPLPVLCEEVIPTAVLS